MMQESEKKKSTNVCSVPGCGNRERPLHKFPNPKKNFDLIKKWVKLINNPTYNKLTLKQTYARGFVCRKHFLPDDYKVGAPNTLAQNALPSLNLPAISVETSDSAPVAPVSLVKEPIDLPKTVDREEKSLAYIEGYEVIKHLSVFKTLELDDISYIDLESLATALPPQEETNLFNDLPDNLESANVDETVDLPVKLNKTIPRVVKGPLFKSLKETDTILEKCRICFASLKEGEFIKLNSCVEEELVHMTDMLKFVLTDIDLEIYSDVVICVKCTELLAYSYQLKKSWLATEETLENILKENKCLKRNDDVVVYEGLTENEKTIKVDIITEPVVHSGHDHDYTSLRKSGRGKYVRVQKKKVKMPKFCEICGKFVFHLSGHLQRHKKNEKEIPKDRRKVCEVCGLLIKPGGLASHVEKHTVEPNCSICGKIFNNKQALKAHTRNVHQKANYQCHICGKQVYGFGTFYGHLRRHTPKSWVCSICGKVLASPQSLNKHRLMHNPQNCVCHICGKKVKYKSSLEKHVQIFHMNMSKNFCDVCEKPYWKKHDLDKHKIRVHGIFPGETPND